MDVQFLIQKNVTRDEFVETRDEFSEIFDNLATEIVVVSFILIVEVFNNLGYVFLVMYEKYGGDPKKRSITNRLQGQTAYPMVLNNIVNGLILIWRCLIGPIFPILAQFAFLIRHLTLVWILFCFTEILICRAFMTTHWQIFVGINENFLELSLFTFNFGFAFISQLSRVYLHSFDIALDYHLFIGFEIDLDKSRPTFWPILLGLTTIISIISLTIIKVKKSIEDRKDSDLIQRIQVNLHKVENQNETKENNANKPVLKSVETLVVFGAITISFVLVTYTHFMSKRSKYHLRFYQELFIQFLFKIILPIFIIIRNHDFRKFLKRTVSDLHLYLIE